MTETTTLPHPHHLPSAALTRLRGGAWLRAAAALGLALLPLLGAVSPARAGAAATGFNVPSIVLPGVGDSATVIVTTMDVEPAVNGVQLNIQHPAAVSISAPECAGLFAGGMATPTAVADGGTVMGCVLLGRSVNEPSGGVMTFTVTRVAEGEGTLSFGTQGALATQFSADGSAVPAGETNTLAILSAAALRPAGR